MMGAMAALRRATLALLVLTATCAAPAPPPPAAPAPAPAPPKPSSQPWGPHGADIPPRPPESRPATPFEEKLPWVNPARCLAPCTFDPGDELVSIDATGAPDPRGPHRVTKAVQGALRGLLAAAAGAGHTLTVNSAFRSYQEQSRLFSSIKQPGRAALPGQSEHQVGTAVDLKLPGPDAAAWLAEHVAEHGFVRSYPEGKQKVTGYRPEPWHVRFVGYQLAQEARGKGLTLEELFRLRPGLGVSGSCEDCPARASRKPCGKITAAGACSRGVLLSWCYEGALATVDCSAFGQRCESDGAEADCR
jgi:D-alanyl-D-alanine carboxypeptidase